MDSSERPSATSAAVKSNSSLATKSIAGEAWSDRSGWTATSAPTKPTRRSGFFPFSASATFTSPANVGELVCRIIRSCWSARVTMSSRVSPAGGASTSVLPGTRAAGWASQVGYQYERISRFAWYLAPAPPSKPSKDGGFRNSVRNVGTWLLPGLQVKADPPQGGKVHGLPARNPAGKRADGVVTQGEHAGGHPAGGGHAGAGVPQFEFMLQVVPPMAGHHVKQQQVTPHHPGLAARHRPGQRHDHVGGGHQLGDPVGEAERSDPGPAGGQLAQPPLDPAIPARHRQHVHAGVGQPGHGP